MAGGSAVQAAGEVRIVNGKVYSIDKASGHYLPSGRSAEQAAVNAFVNAGLGGRGEYIEKVWSGGKWAPK